MMIETTIQGIPCLVDVIYYAPERPMRITGSGFGDAEPPEPEEFEYQVLTRDEHPAGRWLTDKITPGEDERIRQEIRRQMDQRNQRPEP